MIKNDKIYSIKSQMKKTKKVIWNFKTKFLKIEMKCWIFYSFCDILCYFCQWWVFWRIHYIPPELIKSLSVNIKAITLYWLSDVSKWSRSWVTLAASDRLLVKLLELDNGLLLLRSLIAHIHSSINTDNNIYI